MSAESNKPEWFQIADSDNANAPELKASKRLPAVAVLVTGAVIATGAFFASASEKESVGGSAVAQVDISRENNAPLVGSSEAETLGGVVAPGAEVKKPGEPGNFEDDAHDFGNRPPHREGDDDEEHEFGERQEHEDGEERHERGERRERGERHRDSGAPTIPAPSASSGANA